MIVYVVMSYFCSSPHPDIEGIYVDKEAAETEAARIAKDTWEDVDVEEWELIE